MKSWRDNFKQTWKFFSFSILSEQILTYVKTTSRSLSLTFINNFITYTLTSFSLNWRDINRSWRLPGKLYCIHNSSVLISASCQDGYAAYIAPEFQVWLKLVPVSSDYTKAKEHCEAEGGDLIRIDSTLKYDIFKQMLGKKKV